MSNVHRLHEPDQTAQACEWLARLERGMTGDERRQLTHWLSLDKGHHRALMDAASLWDKMDSLSRLADLFPKPIPRQTNTFAWTLALAAAALLAIGIGLSIAGPAVWSPGDQTTGITSHTVASRTRGSDATHTAGTGKYAQVFETAIGEHSTVRLPDGSELTLNTNSRVHAEFANGRRVLQLERGEVFVKVAHDATRPFLVLAGERVVRAVGTTFNVEIKHDQKVEVIVTEGRVLIGVVDRNAPPHEAEWLERFDTPVAAGERVLLGSEPSKVQEIKPDEIDVKLSWRAGNIVFHGEPLEEALDEIERYTKVTFVIQDEKLKTIRVAGLFKAGDVDGLLETLRRNFNIAYERVGAERIVLKQRQE